MTTLQSYLKEVLGFRVTVPEKASENLIHTQNSTFAKNYKFYEIIISRTAVIIAQREMPLSVNGSNIAKEYQSMKTYFKFPLLIELQSTDKKMRKLLIGKKVNFAVPGQQLHFPELGISLSEQNIRSPKSVKTLTTAAQVLLLYHLQKCSLANTPFKVIAGLIGYSAKTVTLIANELCNFGIAMVEVNGHNRSLRFYKHGIELYNQIDSWLQSPVLSSGYTDRDIITFESVKTGETIIISSKVAKELKLYKSPKKYFVEIWKYDPAILSSNGMADELSVLLSKIIKRYGYIDKSGYKRAKTEILSQINWADKHDDK